MLWTLVTLQNATFKEKKEKKKLREYFPQQGIETE